MPKKTPKPSVSTVTDAVKSLQTLDAFQNILARTGYGTPNLMEGTQYPLTRLTKEYNLMNSLYRNSWVAHRVIDVIPKDMMKNWVKYNSDISPEEIDKIHKMERQIRLRPKLLRGLKWGRLYGGAAGLIMLEGQEDNLEEPLDLDSIMPGDFKGLLIVDRWSGVYPQLQLVEDISNPEFGLPKYYEFQDTSKRIVSRAHHSRIVRFTGMELPEWETQAETYWGMSVIEPLFEELKKRDNASANISLLIFQASLKIFKIKDLDQLLAGQNTKVQQDFYNVLEAQNWLRNSFGTQLIGAEDDFSSVDYTFSGLNDIYESFMLDVAGAAEIPVTKLFGRSPAGMNSTGESDLTNYYDVIEDEQESHLRPALEKLLPVMAMSALGFIPDDLEFEFNPIETPSEKDVGETIKWKTEAVLAVHDRGIISTQVALKEFKQMSEGTSLFTNITDEDINKASDEAQPKLDITDPDGKLPNESLESNENNEEE